MKFVSKANLTYFYNKMLNKIEAFISPINTKIEELKTSIDDMQENPVPIATNTQLGGVKIGEQFSTDENGILSIDSIEPALLSDAVPLSKGGTGATTSIEARKNIAPLTSLGTNVTGGVENDTFDFWVKQASGVYWFQNGDMIKDQPQRYGYIHHTNLNNGHEIFQTWTTASGAIYRRFFSGSAPETPSWIRILDTNNTVAISNGGTGATDAATARTNLGVAASSHTHSYLPLSGGTMTGQIQKAAAGTSWINGRNTAPFRVSGTVGANSYTPGLSIKSQSGSWELGTYTNNDLYITYVTDSNLANGTNSPSSQVIVSSGQGGISGLKAANISDLKSWLLTNIFKVGYVWVSYTNTSPSSILGGTWTAITGRFPYFNAGTGTGGSSTHSHWQTVGLDWAGAGNLYSTPGDTVTNSRVITAAKVGLNQLSNYTTNAGTRQDATYDASSLPPYQTLYAWRRTA